MVLLPHTAPVLPSLQMCIHVSECGIETVGFHGEEHLVPIGLIFCGVISIHHHAQCCSVIQNQRDKPVTSNTTVITDSKNLAINLCRDVTMMGIRSNEGKDSDKSEMCHDHGDNICTGGRNLPVSV